MRTKRMAEQGVRGQANGLDFSRTPYQPMFRTPTLVRGPSQMHYAFLAVAIISEVIATLLLKLSDGLTKWWWGLVSVFFYSIAGIMLALVLKYMAVGLVYAIWAGVGIALVCCASVLLWGQRFDAAALGGIALIVAGVMLITLKSGVTLH